MEWLKRRLRAWLIEPLPAVTAAKPRREMGVSDAALAEASASYGEPLNAWKIPDRPPGAPKAVLAMDADPGVAGLYAWAMDGVMHEGIGFLGYPYLAELTQRTEYRRASEIIAAEATRKWIKFRGDEKRIDVITKAMERFGIRAKFRKLSEMDGNFGRAQLFIDLGDKPNDTELAKPLVMAAKVTKGSIKNFTTVEPFWSYPGTYESINPLAPDYYKPRYWQIMSAQVHASRLITIVSREVPDMLKPAYSFGGIALSQMIKPYVDNWLRTRQSVSDLTHSFSTPVLKTNMGSVLQAGKSTGLLARLKMLVKTRDNRGFFAIDKESEEFEIVSTPLTGLEKLQAQSQEHICSASGIPLVTFTGVTPSGLNASGEGEMDTHYDNILAYQERNYREPLTYIIDLIQLNELGDIDKELTFDFVHLKEMKESEKAAIRKSDADVDVAYQGIGVVSNDEIRERVTQDEESQYFGMKLEGNDDMIALPVDPNALDDDDDPPPGKGKNKTAHDAAFNESQHPRGPDGRFGSGGGATTVSPPVTNPSVMSILGAAGVQRLRDLIADKSSTAADVLAALQPLDDASHAVAPTLEHNVDPDPAFWASRTYTLDGAPSDRLGAVTYLVEKARGYAGPGGVRRERQARILMGPPAAGKSTSANEIARQGGYAIVDVDDAKRVIPEFNDGLGATAVHEESGKLGSQVLMHILDAGDNVIMPVVGGSREAIETRIEVLKSWGYRVTVDLVDVDEDEAARRMAARALRSGRHISSGYFASIGDGPQRTYKHLQATDPDLGFGRIDGNGPPRTERYTETKGHPTATPGTSLFGRSRSA